MNAAESKKKMKDINFSFFTTIIQGDYYVILFNLLKANAIILDNELDVDYNAKKGLMSSYAWKFADENKDTEKMKKMVEDTINKRIAKEKKELFKFQNDAKLIQLKERMNEIFKDHHIPEYYSFSSTKSNDDNNDDNNEERNDPHYTDDHNAEECVSEDDGNKDDKGEGSEKKDAHEKGSSSNKQVIVLRKRVGETKSHDSFIPGSQPTFDLDISPLFDEVKKTNEVEKKMGKQQVKERVKLKSNYINKKVDTTDALTDIGKKRLREQVFYDDDDVILLIMNVQTLAPWLEVDTSVIDAYCSRLNYEERFKENNIKRNLFYTSMMVPRIIEDKKKDINKKIDGHYAFFSRHHRRSDET
ncbi:hypothetical protein Tco_1024049 [Tanacetum coccineum]